MAFSDPEFQALQTGIAKLTAPGILGFYTHFEVTEVFAQKDGDAPFNVFTILVAEERASDSEQKPKYLGNRIHLKSLKGWTFGIQRHLKSLSEIDQAFVHYHKTGEWKPSGKELQVGELVPIAAQFVPPNSTANVPLNCILKNNFWNGSYVIECTDLKKPSLQTFFDDPRRLQELSTAIQREAPIKLASLSDRLGNVVVQIPVTVIASRFRRSHATGDCIVDLEWHPQAKHRQLRGLCEIQFDNLITGRASADIRAPQTTIPVGSGDGMQRVFIWDDQNQVILAGTANSSFSRTIAMNFHMSSPEPRTFVLKDTDGKAVTVRIPLVTSSRSLVGAPANSASSDWARRRIYREEAERLAAGRNFVQYKPKANLQDAEHAKALRDIRYLLDLYGEDGAWLWDPYLSAQDVLKTLFYCKHSNADLRALTAAQETPKGQSVPPEKMSHYQRFSKWLHMIYGGHEQPRAVIATFSEAQRKVIEDSQSNFHGLRLEYRMKVGQAGWGFHDRFLIFPKKDGGALAWSLGTSVNSLGKQHHILQKVDDGQLVMDAFSELWDALNGAEHLVWKTQ